MRLRDKIQIANDALDLRNMALHNPITSDLQREVWQYDVRQFVAYAMNNAGMRGDWDMCCEIGGAIVRARFMRSRFRMALAQRYF